MHEELAAISRVYRIEQQLLYVRRHYSNVLFPRMQLESYSYNGIPFGVYISSPNESTSSAVEYLLMPHLQLDSVIIQLDCGIHQEIHLAYWELNPAAVALWKAVRSQNLCDEGYKLIRGFSDFNRVTSWGDKSVVRCNAVMRIFFANASQLISSHILWGETRSEFVRQVAETCYNKYCTEETAVAIYKNTCTPKEVLTFGAHARSSKYAQG